MLFSCCKNKQEESRIEEDLHLKLKGIRAI